MLVQALRSSHKHKICVLVFLSLEDEKDKIGQHRKTFFDKPDVLDDLSVHTMCACSVPLVQAAKIMGN